MNENMKETSKGTEGRNRETRKNKKMQLKEKDECIKKGGEQSKERKNTVISE
jgi:hypothetical protein